MANQYDLPILLKKRRILVVNVDLADAVGLEEALFIERLRYLIGFHISTGKARFHAGEYWIYQTLDKWCEAFTFMNPRTVRRIIERLEHQGHFKSARLEAHKNNQAKWYTLDVKKLQSFPVTGYDFGTDIRDYLEHPAQDESGKDGGQFVHIDLDKLATSRGGQIGHLFIEKKSKKEYSLSPSPETPEEPVAVGALRAAAARAKRGSIQVTSEHAQPNLLPDAPPVAPTSRQRKDRPHAEHGEKHQALVSLYKRLVEEYETGADPEIVKNVRHIGKLAAGPWTVEQIEAMYRDLKAKPFYAEKHLDMYRIAQDIAAHQSSKTRRKPGGYILQGDGFNPDGTLKE